MDNILLITYKNSLYHEELVSSGYSVKAISQPLQELDFRDIQSSLAEENTVAIIEVFDDNIPVILSLVNTLEGHAGKILFITQKITSELKSFVYKCGIPDILQSRGPSELLEYLDMYKKLNEESAGKIVVFDDTPEHVSIISGIVSRFKYKIITINSLDDFFDSISISNLQLNLVNLGARGFDVNTFVKQSYSNSLVKRIPLIAYKNMDEGICINEVVSGLNRMTKVILSTQELYSLLINILFRREMYYIIHKLNRSIDTQNIDKYLNGSLGQMCTSTDNDSIVENILSGDNFLNLRKMSRQMNELLIKVDGLMWMLIDMVDYATCGPGA